MTDTVRIRGFVGVPLVGVVAAALGGSRNARRQRIVFREEPFRSPIFGLTVFCTDQSASPADVAVAAEDAGFRLLLFPDHTHVPVQGSDHYPGGGHLPPHYRRTYDPLVASAWALAATSTLHVGIGVCLVAARDPIILAKQVASIDRLAGGRFVFGVGAGWNGAEIANHGVEPEQRWSVMRERVLAMKQIWAHDEAEYHGKHVSFDPIWSWPKPVNPGGPRVMVGGHGDSVIDRVVEYGDEWLVMPAPGRPPLRERIEQMHRRATESGRSGLQVSCQMYGSLRVDVLERMVAAGVDRVDLSVPHAAPDEMLAEIHRLGGQIQELQL